MKIFFTLLFIFTLTSCGSYQERSIAQETAKENCEEMNFIDNDNFFEDYQWCQGKH